MTLDEFSDSFLLQAAGSDSLQSGVNIADMLLSQKNEHVVAHPNVLSQVSLDEAPIFAGQIETADGNFLPLTVGQTDIGNGKPAQYIHISDDPSILSRHLSITTVQTQDGKFRASVRMNYPHGQVLLGGSVVRPEVSYPIYDDDEVVIGDGVKFRFRLNNQPRARQSIGGPTQQYVPARDSDEVHESEEREKEEKRRQFQERLTPDDSILMQIAASADPDREISLHHEVGDTCPYSSSLATDDAGMEPETLVQEEMADPPTPVQNKDEEFILPESIDATPAQPIEDNDESVLTEGPPADEAVGTQPPPEELSRLETDEGGRGSAGEAQDETEEAPQEEEENASEPRRSKRTAAAPQLSQEAENEAPEVMVQPSPIEGRSLLERVTRRMGKRGLSDLNVEVKQELQETQDSAAAPAKKRTRGRKDAEEIITTTTSRRGSTRSSPRFSEGPKKLTFLKTAIEIDKQTEAAVTSSGGKFESKWSDRVEALVTGFIVRTTKFLCAINKGLAIFPKSILSEVRVNKALPPINEPAIWLKDPEGEAKYDFNLQESILRARDKPLLQGFDVFCYKGGIGEFSAEEFKDLVTTAGGRLITRLPKAIPVNDVENNGYGIVIIGSEKDVATAKAVGVTFFNKIEFFVDACIKQKLDFNCARVNV